MLKGNAVVGQSGGPTAAINATLSGVIRGAKECEAIQTLYGMRNGIEGFLDERLIDLTEAFAQEERLFDLECTPSAALGSCRKKLPDPEKETEIYEKLFSLFRKYDIRYFFYIGGNDSMDTVDKLSRFAVKENWEMRFMGVPKTIDNDLFLTDHTPGFGSAAKFIATEMEEIACDCAVYTVKAVTIVEIMGRDAGWLTAAAGLPRLIGERTADLIYLPEVPFDCNAFLEDVRAELAKKPNVVVAVSEGVRTADGRYVGEGTQSGAVDNFGHKYLAGTAKELERLVKENIGCKVRSVELNLPQRCASHLASACDLEESVRVGKGAVLAAADGATGAIMIFERQPGATYHVEVRPAQVCDVANKIKAVPRCGINERGNNVTDALLQEILPLIQGDVSVPKKNGMPVHIKL